MPAALRTKEKTITPIVLYAAQNAMLIAMTKGNAVENKENIIMEEVTLSAAEPHYAVPCIICGTFVDLNDRER